MRKYEQLLRLKSLHSGQLGVVVVSHCIKRQWKCSYPVILEGGKSWLGVGST